MSSSGSGGANSGRHFALNGPDLRISSVSGHGSVSTGLSEDASRKHVATYSQVYHGPLELSTIEAMAKTVHDMRAKPGQKNQPTNTVAIFHESTLPSAAETRNAKGKVSGKELDVSRAWVLETARRSGVTSGATLRGASSMHFDNNNNHFKELK